MALLFLKMTLFYILIRAAATFFPKEALLLGLILIGEAGLLEAGLELLLDFVLADFSICLLILAMIFVGEELALDCLNLLNLLFLKLM